MAKWIDRRIGAGMARNNRPDTAADIAARVARNQAVEVLRAEMAERYPVLTAENIDEALAYQQRRLAELEGR